MARLPHREIVPTVKNLGLSLMLVAASGCSLVFVKKAPPEVQPGAWADCTEGKFSPTGDVVMGSLFVISAFGISAAEDENPELRNTAAAFYGLSGLALLYSAYVGFRETGRCQQIRRDAAARGVYGPYPPPQPYPYPYPPPGQYPQPYPYPPQPQPYPPQPYPQPQPQPQPQPPR